MDVAAVVSKLKKQYPDSNIKELPPGPDATEIVCELPAKSSEHSVAIAVIDESKPHFHKRMDEHYKVLEGTLQLFVDEQLHVLNPGDNYVIKPQQIHYAKGNATWIQVDCYPAYSKDDHFLV